MFHWNVEFVVNINCYLLFVSGETPFSDIMTSTQEKAKIVRFVHECGSIIQAQRHFQHEMNKPALKDIPYEDG